MPLQDVVIEDFTGGQNSEDSPRLLANNEVELLRNGVYAGRGEIQKRQGWSPVSGGATFLNSIDRIRLFPRWDGSFLKMVISGNALYQYNDSGTILQSGLSNGPYGTEVMQDKFLLVDGTNFYESDGTVGGTQAVTVPGDTGATLTEVQRCHELFEWRGRLYATGDENAPRTIYYSQSNRYDYYKSGDMQITEVADDGITNKVLRSGLSGSLLIGKPSGVWRMVDDPADLDFLSTGVRKIASIGPISSKSCITIGDDLIFLYYDGLYMLTIIDESPTLIPLTNRSARRRIIEAHSLDNAVLFYHNEQVYLAFQEESSSSGNDIILVWDTRFKSQNNPLGAMYEITGWDASDFIQTEDNELWIGKDSQGSLMLAFDGSYDDDGEDVTFEMHTKEYALDSPHIIKRFSRGFILLRQFTGIVNDLTLELEVAFGLKRYTVSSRDGSSLVWGSGVWGSSFWGASESVERGFRLNRYLDGTYIQFKISETSSTQLGIQALGISYRPIRRVLSSTQEVTPV